MTPMRSRPGEQEKAFWNLADWAIKNGYATTRQVCVIARLEGSRKTGAWKRHLLDLREFMTWKAEQSDKRSEGKGVSARTDRERSERAGFAPRDAERHDHSEAPATVTDREVKHVERLAK